MSTLSYSQWIDSIRVQVGPETTIATLSPISTGVNQQIKLDSMANLLITQAGSESYYMINLYYGLKRTTGTTSTIISVYNFRHTQTNAPARPRSYEYETLPLNLTWVDSPPAGTHIYSIFIQVYFAEIAIYDLIVGTASLNAIVFP